MLKAILKSITNVNDCSIVDATLETDVKGGGVIHLYIKQHRGHDNRCPICGKRCSGYDKANGDDNAKYSTWRDLDSGGHKVYLHCKLKRVLCTEHGVHTAGVSWAFYNSRFTKAFDMTASFLGIKINRKTASEYLRCDWETVGRCIGRTRAFIGPDPRRRYSGLKHIGVDETGYRKGHKYITVVVNHDTGEVVCCHEGHSVESFSKFFEELTEEQRQGIETVSGDGARWIDACMEKYIPHATRTIDGFHVVCWCTNALDQLRPESWRLGQKQLKEQQTLCGKRDVGRPKKDDPDAAKLSQAKSAASDIKGSVYAIGKVPEHLTENQKAKLGLIAKSSPVLYRSYKLKEFLRCAFKLNDIDEVKAVLKEFFWKATHSRISVFKELAYKIRRHEEKILNTIKTGLSNASVESVNNKIKLFVRKAYGFRNLQNMYDIIMLGCSKLTGTLPNKGNVPLKLV